MTGQADREEEADPHNPNVGVRAGCDHRVGCKVFGNLDDRKVA